MQPGSILSYQIVTLLTKNLALVVPHDTSSSGIVLFSSEQHLVDSFRRRSSITGAAILERCCSTHPLDRRSEKKKVPLGRGYYVWPTTVRLPSAYVSSKVVGKTFALCCDHGHCVHRSIAPTPKRTEVLPLALVDPKSRNTSVTLGPHLDQQRSQISILLRFHL